MVLRLNEPRRNPTVRISEGNRTDSFSISFASTSGAFGRRMDSENLRDSNIGVLSVCDFMAHNSSPVLSTRTCDCNEIYRPNLGAKWARNYSQKCTNREVSRK